MTIVGNRKERLLMEFRMNSPEESRQLPLSPPKLKCDSLMFRFPARLWKIVNACRSGAISWGPSGKTIRIVRSKFEAHYLTSYDKPFKTDRFSSFVRQLNLYGFKKVAAPMVLDGEMIEYDDLYEYLNPRFKQGRSELLPYLQRNCKKNKSDWKPSPSDHKGKAFEEIQQNVICESVSHEQSREHSQKEERKRDIAKVQQQAHWNSESGIENHPLLKPLNRTGTLLQRSPLIPQLSGQPATTISGMIDQSRESWAGSGWLRQAYHNRDQTGQEGTDSADKADTTETTINGGFHSIVNLNSCSIENEQLVSYAKQGQLYNR
ncbi:hypothetical protein LOTGIDRAFT_231335 [Lottia gigantea]|uniref:HSF-type DNA-binding domain-containing protein n=1 Tax=Lottia gigantea TaxID=225164 RepID=V4A2X9_LOTGI|nr:hypothetical protein LOTGIDRAFT_231335 [Lottia gigantea]ESO98218.1 hypothetical protein LOTGIDRAFT_231335 [Lottia gigantea]